MDATLTDRKAGISVRLARPSDLPALRSLLERCSPEALYRRFHGVVGRSVHRELARIATPTATHRSWVAVGAGDVVHGTATLAWGRDGEVEVAFLVEDALRRRGVGRALVAATLREAAARDVPEVLARIQGDNAGAARFLRAVVPDATLRFREGMTVGTIPVARSPRTAVTVPDSRRAVPVGPAARPPIRIETHQEVAS